MSEQTRGQKIVAEWCKTNSSLTPYSQAPWMADLAHRIDQELAKVVAAADTPKRVLDLRELSRWDETMHGLEFAERGSVCDVNDVIGSILTQLPDVEVIE